jgi:hypothetical protein
LPEKCRQTAIIHWRAEGGIQLNSPIKIINNMFRGGQPYTTFRSINAKDGLIRFEGKPFGARLAVASNTITANRKVDICDADGTMFVKGYHLLFGSALVSGTLSLVPVGDFMTCHVNGITGVKTSSVVFAGVISTATAAGIAVAGARCTTAGSIELTLTNVTAATIGNGSLYINYMVLHPATT